MNEKPRKFKQIRYRTIKIPAGWELDVSQLYLAGFTEDKVARGKIRLYLKRQKNDY